MLYGCSIDRLFGMDSMLFPRTMIEEGYVQQLIKSGDYNSVLSHFLAKCEAHRDDFRLLSETLNLTLRYRLYNHPDLPKILPLIYHCERYCSDPDLLHLIIFFSLKIAGRSSIPVLHTKTREFYQRLPGQRYARERCILSVMQGDELNKKIQENIWFYFEEGLTFLHHMAENAETTEEQLRLHHILCKVFEALSEGKFCGIFDGMFLNSYHKMAWKHMQLGQRKEAEACVNTIIQRLRQHLCTEDRNHASDLFCAVPGAEAKTALPLLRRMERHPDLAPFREKIKAFREEYEKDIKNFKGENQHA